MFEIFVAVGACLVILGAWFLLRIGVAELILISFLLLSTGVGIYWLWTGGAYPKSFEGIGLFVLVLIILGSTRVGIEKLSGMLAASTAFWHRRLR